MSDLDFFNDAAVDPALYEAEKAVRVSFPTISWQGQHGSPIVGTWALDDNGGELPGPFWRREKVQFGGNPNSPYVDAMLTERLRCCVLGFRQRWSATDPNGTVHYYPDATPPNQRPQGRPQSHLQVAVTMPGDPTAVYALGLNGPSKTKPFLNENDGAENAMPLGVWPRLRRYAAAASEQQGQRIPALCTWWIDLVPHRAAAGSPRAGEFIYVTEGTTKVAHMLPYVADLRTDRDKGGEASDGATHHPRTRFVGRDLFEEYQRLYKATIRDWAAEWDTAYTAEPEEDGGPYPPAPAAPGPSHAGRRPSPPEPPDDWL